jgi:hypothetical protein
VINKNLGVTPPALARPARLRADQIRVNDLVQLGRALAAGDDRARLLLDALEDLGQIADTAREGELDATVQDIETYARLDRAEMDLTDGDVRQLLRQSAHAANAADGVVVHLPTQQDRRWTA